MFVVKILTVLVSLTCVVAVSKLGAQEKLTVSYSSVDAPSANWYIAQEKGFYKKYGMGSRLILDGRQTFWKRAQTHLITRGWNFQARRPRADHCPCAWSP